MVWWSGGQGMGKGGRRRRRENQPQGFQGGPPVAMMVMIYRAEVNPAGPELGELKSAVVPLIHQFVLDNIMILKF